jgi:hypothetical protein
MILNGSNYQLLYELSKLSFRHCSMLDYTFEQVDIRLVSIQGENRRLIANSKQACEVVHSPVFDRQL